MDNFNEGYYNELLDLEDLLVDNEATLDLEYFSLTTEEY